MNSEVNSIRDWRDCGLAVAVQLFTLFTLFTMKGGLKVKAGSN